MLGIQFLEDLSAKMAALADGFFGICRLLLIAPSRRERQEVIEYLN